MWTISELVFNPKHSTSSVCLPQCLWSWDWNDQLLLMTCYSFVFSKYTYHCGKTLSRKWRCRIEGITLGHSQNFLLHCVGSYCQRTSDTALCKSQSCQILIGRLLEKWACCTVHHQCDLRGGVERIQNNYLQVISVVKKQWTIWGPIAK